MKDLEPTEVNAEAKAVINNLPIGTVMPYMGLDSTIAGLKAQGWLLCDGKSFGIDEQRSLYNAIGKSCGGNESNFNVPDLRGMFLRGCDGGSGRDPDADGRTGQGGGAFTGNQVGTRQGDEFKSHKHTTNVADPSDWFSITHSGKDWHPPRDKKDIASSEAGGKETRPMNVYTYYIIFAGLPQ